MSVYRFGFAIFCSLLLIGSLFADDAAWLETGLPAAGDEGIKFTIKKVEVSRNHVDQELSKTTWERTPQIYRTAPREVKVVILPSGGGRHEAAAAGEITLGPAQSGTVGGIHDLLLDYRGKIPGGARVYMEMTASGFGKKEPVRISNVFWFGSADELKAAQKAGNPVDPSDKNKQSIVLKSPDDKMGLPAGMPVRFAGGQRWFPGTLLEKSSAGQPLKLVVFPVRPGKAHAPFYVSADRSEVKIEAAAVEAAKTDATWFADHFREAKGRATQSGAPLTIKPAGEKVKKGDRILWFGFHGLTGAEALEDSADGKVKAKDSTFGQEHTLEVGLLYVDPEPAK